MIEGKSETMNDTIYKKSLTTLQRVKDRIFDPNNTLPCTATLTTTTAVITVNTTTSMVVGQAIFGTYLPYGTVITAISGANLTLSNVPLVATTVAVLTVVNQPTAFDNVLIRTINAVTDWIGRETGRFSFLQTLHTNEVYSASGPKQKRLVLRHAPVFYLVTTGNTTTGSATITGMPSTVGLYPNMPVFGDNITRGARILTVDSPTQITLIGTPSSGIGSGNATSNATAMPLTITGLLGFQWRTGTPSYPTWTDFILDQYELINDGRAGVIRIYGVFPRMYNNMIRVDYYSGYLINWANAGDQVTHTLPADLTNACENIVVRWFKRRQLAGKTSEALDGASTSWSKDIDTEDQAVIGHYRRMPTIW